MLEVKAVKRLTVSDTLCVYAQPCCLAHLESNFSRMRRYLGSAIPEFKTILIVSLLSLIVLLMNERHRWPIKRNYVTYLFMA